jgi:hypothetical protein
MVARQYMSIFQIRVNCLRAKYAEMVEPALHGPLAIARDHPRADPRLCAGIVCCAASAVSTFVVVKVRFGRAPTADTKSVSTTK